MIVAVTVDANVVVSIMFCSPGRAEVSLGFAPRDFLKEVGGLDGLPDTRLRGWPEVLDRACSAAVVPNEGGARPAHNSKTN